MIFLRSYGIISKILVGVLLIFSISGDVFGNDVKRADATLLHRSQKALTKVIIHDIFSPPVASRIYVYANMAAYESAVLMQQRYKSLSQSIEGFPEIKFKTADADPQLAAVYAFFKVGARFVFSEKQLLDSLEEIVKEFRVNEKSRLASLSLGDSIAQRVILWAVKDHYNETRKLRRYTHLKQSGKWLPTPPGYIAAIEPNWGSMRPIALDSATQFRPLPPPEFSIQKESEFYRQAEEVYREVLQLDAEKRDIANFWDCNPFYLNTQGHLNFATKKMSPGAHWILIAGNAAQKSNADLMQASAAYVMTAIAIYDGFISCWDEKYRSNVIRPETYINAYMDEKWRPLLQTPPFPEYTSGHSVISTAAAQVLTSIFGDMFGFVDVSEVDYGIGPRSFASFYQAAEEAAISRLYGGIHYKAAIKNGQLQGERIGREVLKKIKLR